MQELDVKKWKMLNLLDNRLCFVAPHEIVEASLNDVVLQIRCMLSLSSKQRKLPTRLDLFFRNTFSVLKISVSNLSRYG
jgi:hypothetical protein